MRIAVGSGNPVKLQAARALDAYGTFEYTAVSVPSGVRDQPMSREETMQGAKQRARNALAAVPHAAYGLGLEGGIEDDGNQMWAFACCAIVDRQGMIGEGVTGSFVLPARVRELVLGGMELGHADDIVFGRTNSKQQEGAVGLLSKGKIIRATFYEHATVFAYFRFLHPQLYR